MSAVPTHDGVPRRRGSGGRGSVLSTSLIVRKQVINRRGLRLSLGGDPHAQVGVEAAALVAVLQPSGEDIRGGFDRSPQRIARIDESHVRATARATNLGGDGLEATRQGNVFSVCNRVNDEVLRR